MSAPLHLHVNGEARATRAPAQMPLLYYLRNELMLKGTRFGCGGEGCGACTVLVDGEPAYACTKPLLEAAGREVTTVECAPHRYVEAMQAALLEERAGQCGYCLSGIVMSAAALLMRNSAPTREDAARALERHLCRCGAHPRILRAVLRAARRLAGEA